MFVVVPYPSTDPAELGTKVCKAKTSQVLGPPKHLPIPSPSSVTGTMTIEIVGSVSETSISRQDDFHCRFKSS
jgi:hypothetical protein